MPLSCAAYGCNSHNKMEYKPSFHRFPNNNPERRQRWIAACRRVNEDGSSRNPHGKNVFLCGNHFITGHFSFSRSVYVTKVVKTLEMKYEMASEPLTVLLGHQTVFCPFRTQRRKYRHCRGRKNGS